MEIKGKVVLVTGASRGIGASTAKLFAKHGAKVALVARAADDLNKVVAEIQAQGGTANAFPADLSKQTDVTAMAQAVMTSMGCPSLIINNAGAGRWLFTEETPVGEEDMMIALPYLAAFRVTRAFLPEMLKQSQAMILNVNSPVAILPWSGATGYASSRWALRGFSESLMADLKGTNVRVSEVILGETSSNYFDANPGAHERLPSIAKMLPVITPDQAAGYLIKAVKGNRKRFTAPFMLRLTRWMTYMTPGIVRLVVQAGDVKHPQAK